MQKSIPYFMLILNRMYEAFNILKAIYEGSKIRFMIIDNNFEILLEVNNERMKEKDKKDIISYFSNNGTYKNGSKKADKAIQILDKGRYFVYKQISLDEKILGGIFFIFERKESIIENDKMIKSIMDFIEIGVKTMDSSNRLRLVYNYYDKALEIMNLGIIIINSNGLILHSNEMATNKLSIASDFLIYKNIREVFSELEISQFFYGKKYQFQRKVLSKINNQSFNLSMFSIEEDGSLEYVGIVLDDTKQSYNSEGDYQYSPIYFHDIIGENSRFKFIKNFAMNIAHKEADILILGESGTGKELFARAIHNASARRKGPFVAINCSAIPNDLLESELFGYQSGAFTGASKGGKLGKFELANGGTIFLDEIGDMTFYLQAKLLRVIQERTFERVGGVKSIKVDIRVIAATNKDLKTMVKNETFREDLYYRLNVIPLILPSVRERRDDIKILVDYFFEKYKSSYGNSVDGFEEDALKTLLSYDWPGNIRELDNTIQFLCCVADGKIIDTALVERRIGFTLKKNANTEILNIEEGKIIPLKDLERDAIINALKIFGHSTKGKELAAKALGIGKSTLYKKLLDYSILDV